MDTGQLDFWLKLAGIGFGLWSIMIPIGVMIVRAGVDKISASQDAFQKTLHEYMLTMERRVGIIEADHRVLEAEIRHLLGKKE